MHSNYWHKYKSIFLFLHFSPAEPTSWRTWAFPVISMNRITITNLCFWLCQGRQEFCAGLRDQNFAANSYNGLWGKSLQRCIWQSEQRLSLQTWLWKNMSFNIKREWMWLESAEVLMTQHQIIYSHLVGIAFADLKMYE